MDDCHMQSHPILISVTTPLVTLSLSTHSKTLSSASVSLLKITCDNNLPLASVEKNTTISFSDNQFDYAAEISRHCFFWCLSFSEVTGNYYLVVDAWQLVRD